MQQRPASASEGFSPGEIKDVVVRSLHKFNDHRGWLIELFRHDELQAEFHPAMAYISSTRPGEVRGPHEHVDQADLFYFPGPSNFKLRLWDNRPESKTFRNMMTLFTDAGDPQAVMIPRGVVHGYKNVGDRDGLVINCPNRLYMGVGRREQVDEIRHESGPNLIFRIDD